MSQTGSDTPQPTAPRPSADAAIHGDGLVDTRMMVVVHELFRREIGLAVLDIRSTEAGDTARAAMVSEHLTLMLEGLHHHHTNEDEMLWPVMEERVRAVSAELEPLVELMEAQHAGLAALLTATPRYVDAWRDTASAQARDALADHVEDVWLRMCEHLEAEETSILPLMSRYLTQTEWDAFAKAGAAGTPRRLQLISLGMMLYEGDPEVLALEVAKVPPPLRWIGPPLGRRAYRRYARRVHLSDTPTRGRDLVLG